MEVMVDSAAAASCDCGRMFCGLATWGLLPVRSKVMPSPSLRMRTLKRTGSLNTVPSASNSVSAENSPSVHSRSP